MTTTIRRLAGPIAVLGLALLLAGCAGTAQADQGQPSLGPNAVHIVAKDIAFTTPQVSAPAGKPFQIRFDNQDSAPHNVAIYTDSSASHAVFQGEIFSSGERVYQVPALKPGTYFFRCDVHQNMTGTIVVK